MQLKNFNKLEEIEAVKLDGNYYVKLNDEKVKVHVLKIKKEYFNAIEAGVKKFEIRKNDRNFQVGDLIRFLIINERTSMRILDNSYYLINYLLKDIPKYGLKKGYCIFSIQNLAYNLYYYYFDKKENEFYYVKTF